MARHFPLLFLVVCFGLSKTCHGPSHGIIKSHNTDGILKELKQSMYPIPKADNVNLLEAAFYRHSLILRAKNTQATGKPFVDRILVKKSKRMLMLISRDRVVRTYYISLGRTREGHKVCAGDGRTPEGLYYIDGRNAQSQYHRSLRISYPNTQDVAQAHSKGLHPGGDIMIHGLPRDLVYLGKSHVTKMWTRGCVAVTNEEMDEIWRLVSDGTPIEILP